MFKGYDIWMARFYASVNEVNMQEIVWSLVR